MVELEKIASERDLEKVKLVYSRGIFGGIRRKSLSFETYPENLELTDPDKRLFTPSEKGKYHKEIGSSIGWFGFEGIEDVENKRYVSYQRFSEKITLRYRPAAHEIEKQEKGIVGQFKSIETRPKILRERLTLNDKRELNSREPLVKIPLGTFEMKRGFSPDNDSIEYVKIEDLKEEENKNTIESKVKPKYKEKGSLESNLTEKIIEKKEEENKDTAKQNYEKNKEIPKQNYEKKDNLENNQTIRENKNNIKPNYEKTSEVEKVVKQDLEYIPTTREEKKAPKSNDGGLNNFTLKKDGKTITVTYLMGSKEKPSKKFESIKTSSNDMELTLVDHILLKLNGYSRGLSIGYYGVEKDYNEKNKRHIIFREIDSFDKEINNS